VITLVAIVLAIFVLPQPWGLAAVAGGATIDILQTVAFLRWSQRRRPSVGAETLVGRVAVAVTGLDPRGQVRLDGELWSAESDVPVDPGGEVVVLTVQGVTLRVRPAQEHESG
jgi:membrane protein implicated in regulation of membrane protease activity